MTYFPTKSLIVQIHLQFKLSGLKEVLWILNIFLYDEDWEEGSLSLRVPVLEIRIKRNGYGNGSRTVLTEINILSVPLETWYCHQLTKGREGWLEVGYDKYNVDLWRRNSRLWLGLWEGGQTTYCSVYRIRKFWSRKIASKSLQGLLLSSPKRFR